MSATGRPLAAGAVEPVESSSGRRGGAGREFRRSLAGRCAARPAGFLLGAAGIGLGFAGLALCCSPAAAPRALAPLHLKHVRPANPEGLFLNEEIVFYFDQDLDPASVTSGSVEILSGSGKQARGELRVENDHVRFVPAPVLAADLSDGGYLPDTPYRATLSGFPRADGIRGAHGAVLERTVTFDFQTVRVDHPRTGLVFEDRMQNRSGLLRLFPSTAGQGGLIRGQDSIYLACDKPIDPSTVSADAFQLRRHPDHPAPRVALSPEIVPLRVRVLENDSDLRRRPRPSGLRSSAPAEAWEREPRACLLELTPVTRLAAGVWELSLVAEAESSEPRLQDFGGRRVRPVGLYQPDRASGYWPLRIDPSAETGGREFREEFESRAYFSPVAVPGYDGTACWSESGRVEVRYPAAAGSGADGDVVLEKSEARSDVQGTSLDLAADAACKLGSKPGLVVLRCQGRMSIRGRLERTTPGLGPDAELQRWAKLRAEAEPVTETLSAWLEKQRAADANWTVLVAGGDLEISGTLVTTTPLLLVAGGRIRVPGKVECRLESLWTPEKPVEPEIAGGVYLLRDGGGLDIDPKPAPAPLLLDAPQDGNPLRKKLRFAALSGPIPQRGGVLRWLPPDSGGSPESASGAWRIRFVPEIAPGPAGPTELHPVEGPALLDPPGPVQFLVELEVEPAGDKTRAWNPPWVDYVHLSWDQPQAEAGQGGDDR